MSEMTAAPDLYRLAFMPGQFRCPECDFQWSIQTINVARGEIGTTEENRQTPDCPNDGTRMVMVTYREQLEAYADRLKEELDRRDILLDALRTAQPYIEFYAQREINSPSNNQQAVIETREMLSKVRRAVEENK
jgi:hypothetical protein